MEICILCRRPLAPKASMVKGALLIHAACWVDESKGSFVSLAQYRRSRWEARDENEVTPPAAA